MESLPRTLDRIYEKLNPTGEETVTLASASSGAAPTRAQPVFGRARHPASRPGAAAAASAPAAAGGPMAESGAAGGPMAESGAAGGPTAESGAAGTALAGSPAAATEPWAELENLSQLFDLTPFERDVLALLTGHCLESRFAQTPTFGLALASLGDPHWSALSSARPLRYWQLVHVDPASLLHSPLNLDERILAYLLGLPAVEEGLQPLIRPVRAAAPPPAPAGPGQAERDALAPGLRYWSQPGLPREPLLVAGLTPGARERAFTSICSGCGLVPFSIEATDIPESAVDREHLARLWSREAGLRGAALYIQTENLDSARAVTGFLHALEAHTAVEIRPGGPAEQLDGIRVDALREPGPERRAHARAALRDLAARVEPAAGWADLVLAEAQLEPLRQIAAHVRHRDLVDDQWGFAAKHPRGLGLTALFAGASGTGKTMAAEVIAADLGLDLYQIDLATVVSKYIGETEKNLREIFTAAAGTDAILLFDEADALFGKRSEVRDSHDRYANLEVSYLLQQMEAYRGAAILTTNMQHAIDPAFLRRLRFIIQFPFPDAAARARIWQGIFPAATPVRELDAEGLAQLGIAGGTIRNIAILAAFLAAEDGGPVSRGYILAAVRTEYAKLGKPLTAAETRSLTGTTAETGGRA